MDTSEKYIKMCSSAKEIHHKWVFQSGDFVFDPDFEEVQVLLYYPAKDFSDYFWLPRCDQLQEICIEFFIMNLKISRNEAFLRFLEWYISCLQEALENGIYMNPECGFIDSGEELLFKYAMAMLYGKRWDGEKWVKALEGYKSLDNSHKKF